MLPEVDPASEPQRLGRWLVVMLGLALIAATKAESGLVLATPALLAVICALLDLGRVERIGAGVAPTAAATGVIALVYASHTSQIVFGLVLGGAYLLAVAQAAADPTRPLVRSLMVSSFILGVISAGFTITAALVEGGLPGWWIGEHPPLTEAWQQVWQHATSSALPEAPQP